MVNNNIIELDGSYFSKVTDAYPQTNLKGVDLRVKVMTHNDHRTEGSSSNESNYEIEKLENNPFFLLHPFTSNLKKQENCANHGDNKEIPFQLFDWECQ